MRQKLAQSWRQRIVKNERFEEEAKPNVIKINYRADPQKDFCSNRLPQNAEQKNWSSALLWSFETRWSLAAKAQLLMIFTS